MGASSKPRKQRAARRAESVSIRFDATPFQSNIQSTGVPYGAEVMASNGTSPNPLIDNTALETVLKYTDTVRDA